MGKALDEMRINWDSQLKIKELPTVSNPLLARRMKKSKTNEKLSELSKTSAPKATSTNTQTSPNTISSIRESDSKKLASSNTIVDKDIKIQNLSREPSDISMRSLTPSNSRQSSPQRK